MQRFRSMKTLQKFSSVHAQVHNHFNQERHLITRQVYKQRRLRAAARACRGGHARSRGLSETAKRDCEEVCDRGNLERAWKRVRSNKGSPGVGGMTIDAAKDYLREHWPNIRAPLLEGTYQPQPVKRVEIPKPDGGIRKLGVPCVVDRLIQQAMLQVLQERWDPTFSEHSYGF